MSPTVGVLSLQGDFREHRAMLDEIGQKNIGVRTIADLQSIDGLIIPGGESTVIQKLAENFDLFEPIKCAIRDGLPAFGTCAGLIMLADQILDGIDGQAGFGGLDVSVRRNAFGNQLDSFETDLQVSGIADTVHAAFIRAPIVERVGPEVEVLSTLPDGRIVAVKQRNILGISFHPEVTGETAIHRFFTTFLK